MMEKTQHEAVVLQEERTEGMPPPETNRNLEKSPEEEVESEVCWSADKSDGQLMRCLDLLMHIHKTYYDQLDASPGLKRMIKVESDPSPALSTACILGAMKSQILCGCVVAFSCIFPNQFDQAKIERQPLWRQACDLGAIVEHGVNPHTTHLITMQPATNKAKMCFAMKSVSVVHPDWLLDCLWNVRRAAEATYAMGPMPTLDPPPYLPSTMEAVASNDSDSIDLKRRRIDKSTEDVDNETWGSCGVTAGGDSDSDEEWMRSMEDEVADALG